MRIIIAIVFIGLASHAQAQEQPFRDSIMRIKGIWKRSGDYLTDAGWHMPKNQQEAALKIGLAMHQLIKQAYPHLKGINAHYYTSIRGEAAIDRAPFPYTVSTGYFWYYYNTAYKKIIPVDETGTYVRIDVNDPSYMLSTYTYSGKPQYAEIDGKFHMVRELWMKDGELRGYTLYRAPAKEAASGYMRCIAIIKDGPPLWLPVSQLQFLQMLRQQEVKALNAVVTDYDKGDSSMRAMIAGIQKMAVDNAMKEKLLARQQELIRDHQQKRDTTIKIRSALWIKRIRLIDEYIANHSKETLDQQAMLGMGEFHSHGFVNSGDKYVRRMVYINPAYFNYQLPRYEPQFIVLRFSVNMNYEPCRYMRDQFEKNFNLQQLKSFLK